MKHRKVELGNKLRISRLNDEYEVTIVGEDGLERDLRVFVDLMEGGYLEFPFTERSSKQHMRAVDLDDPTELEEPIL